VEFGTIRTHITSSRTQNQSFGVIVSVGTVGYLEDLYCHTITSWDLRYRPSARPQTTLTQHITVKWPRHWGGALVVVGRVRYSVGWPGVGHGSNFPDQIQSNTIRIN